jgi:hypothetical protein
MIELGGFLPGSPGLVEVLGPGSGAGSEVECLAGPVGDLVDVGSGGSLAPVAAFDVGALGVGRRPDPGGVGVAQGYIVAGGQ